MVIEGPFKQAVVEEPLNPTHQLEFSFTAEFQALEVEARASALRGYIRRIEQLVGALPEDPDDRKGMQIVLQFAEQVLPHFENDEIPLNEPIAVNIRAEITSVNPVTSLGKGIN